MRMRGSLLQSFEASYAPPSRRFIAIFAAGGLALTLSAACTAESFDGPTIPVEPETVTVTVPVPSPSETILPAPVVTDEPEPSTSTSSLPKKLPKPSATQNMGAFVGDSAGCKLYEKPGSLFNLECEIQPDTQPDTIYWIYKPENHQDVLGGGEAGYKGPMTFLLNHRANEPFCVGYEKSNGDDFIAIAKFNINRYPTQGSC